MRNLELPKVLRALYYHVGKEIDYKRVVLDFEEYMRDELAMSELRDMSAKDVVRIIKEVWEEVKSED